HNPLTSSQTHRPEPTMRSSPSSDPIRRRGNWRRSRAKCSNTSIAVLPPMPQMDVRVHHNVHALFSDRLTKEVVLREMKAPVLAFNDWVLEERPALHGSRPLLV